MGQFACESCPFANPDEPACYPTDEQWSGLDNTVDTEVARCAFGRLAYDKLTGLYTYGAFSTKLQQAFEHERASDIYEVETAEGTVRQRPGGFIFIDGEKTHDLDQEIGHDALDAGLEGIGRLLSDTLRDGDLCCRRSGDEFIVFLPGREVEVNVVTDRLREAMQIGVPLEGGKRLTTRLHLEYRDHIASYEAAKEMINEADIKLGEAKRRRDEAPPSVSGPSVGNRRCFGSTVLGRLGLRLMRGNSGDSSL